MKQKPTEDEVRAAINVILSDKPAYSKSLKWAVAYCELGKALMGEALRIQCLYILNNITHWRHPDAKRVRDILKRFIAVAAMLLAGCAGAPVCSIDNIYIYDAEVCLEAYAEAMDEDECFTDTCCEMDDMAYFEATGKVRK